MKWPWQKAKAVEPPTPQMNVEVPAGASRLLLDVLSEAGYDVPGLPTAYCEISRGVRGKQVIWETHSVCGPRLKKAGETDHVVTTGHWVER